MGLILLLLLGCGAGFWAVLAEDRIGADFRSLDSLAQHPKPAGKPGSDPAAVPLVAPVEYFATTPDEARKRNSLLPFSTAPNLPAPAFRLTGDLPMRERAVTCLAAAAWYEAGDDLLGASAVAQVVLNRLRHPAFPNSVCAVVFQGAERRTGCQFTFTCDGSLQRRHPGAAAWSRARMVANAALSGAVFAPIGLATHYHTDWVQPKWSPEMDKITAVRTHLFFRWKGAWGRIDRLNQPYGGAEVVDSRIAWLDTAEPTPTTGQPIKVEPVMLSADEKEGAAPTYADISPHSVEAADPLHNIYVIRLHPGAFAGSHAIAAWKLCQDKSFCRVAGWADDMKLPAGALKDPAASHPLFLFERRAGGTPVIKWDCQLVARQNATQCLPSTRDAGTPS